MKKILLLLVAAIAALPLYAAVEVVTKGTGKTYSFKTLSTIENSGVSAVNGEYVVANNITISEGDNFKLDDNAVIRLCDGVTVRLEGGISMELEEGSMVTRNAETDVPKGFILASNLPDTIVCSNLSMEYASLKCVIESHLYVHDCSFKFSNGALSGGGALTLGTTGSSYTVENCEFISNTVPAIGCAANFVVGTSITGCNFEDNNSDNTNKPQVNLVVGGDKDLVVRDCIFLGARRTKVGGIGISNFANISGTNNVYIENNTIKYHRFGIGLTYGAMNVFVKNNQIIENKYEEDPMMGGSGISAQDMTELMALYCEGNTIEDHFWGVTLIGCKTANLGKVDDPNAPDYNPGNNVFKNNGNNNIPYDLFNNGPYTVYAQGNIWGVDEQTAEKIETVISHKVDDPKLGEVIFMPAGTGGVEKVAADHLVFDSASKQLSGAEGLVEVYTVSGQLAARAIPVCGTADLSDLNAGVYVVKAGGKVLKIVL